MPKLELYKVSSVKCPHLVKKVICSAIEEPFIPSIFELNEYCRKKDHKKCPFYLGLTGERKICAKENDLKLFT